MKLKIPFKNAEICLGGLYVTVPEHEQLALAETIRKMQEHKEKWLTLETKRSLSANAYLWVLIDKIAKAVGATKEIVYKHHVRDVGCFDVITIAAETVPAFQAKWEAKGLGWQIEVFAMDDATAEVAIYYGSSVYSQEEMTALIDDVIYEAKELGIETLPPDELEKMLDSWKGDGNG